MTRRSARFLTRLYPPAWRARYGEEFQAFLESRHVGRVETLNIISSAFSEQLAGSLPVIVFACLAIVAVAGTLCMPGSAARLARIVETHRMFWLCWAIVEACSLGIVLFGVAAVAPAAIVLFRKPDRRVLWNLAKPVGAGLIVLAVWSLCVARWGIGPFSAWIGLLCLAGILRQSAGFAKYIMDQSDLKQSLGRRKLAFLTAAAAIVLMTATTAAWGGLGVVFLLTGSIIRPALTALRPE